VPHISTWDIFRANVGRGTPLGRKAQEYMDAGDLVPDDITNEMVRDRLREPDAADGFLLDGFPRTVAQAEVLRSLLHEQGLDLDAVLELTVDTDEVVSRLLRRAQEQGRADDTEDVIRRRLDVYADSTAPLTDYYAGRGALVRVDGMGEVDEVTARALSALRTPAA
jgi:adenylate kinase